VASSQDTLIRAELRGLGISGVTHWAFHGPLTLLLSGQRITPSRREVNGMPASPASIAYKKQLAPFQPGQPLPGVLDFGQAGIRVLPEVEEFLVVPARPGFVSQLLVDQADMVEAPRVKVA
jgi:hypothetical protein